MQIEDDACSALMTGGVQRANGIWFKLCSSTQQQITLMWVNTCQQSMISHSWEEVKGLPCPWNWLCFLSGDACCTSRKVEQVWYLKPISTGVMNMVMDSGRQREGGACRCNSQRGHCKWGVHACYTAVSSGSRKNGTSNLLPDPPAEGG